MPDPATTGRQGCRVLVGSWPPAGAAQGPPLVHRPAEAVADFLNSDLDALVLGNLLATKT